MTRILCFTIVALALVACGGSDDHSPQVESTATTTATATATVEIITAVHDSVLNVPIQSVVVRTPSELEEEDKEGAEGKKEEQSEPERRSRRSDREEEKEIEGVFVVDEGDEARFVPVVTGIADELSIQVTGELEVGQKVISGPYRVLRTLKNGAALKVKKEDESGEAEG